MEKLLVIALVAMVDSSLHGSWTCLQSLANCSPTGSEIVKTRKLKRSAFKVKVVQFEISWLHL